MSYEIHYFGKQADDFTEKAESAIEQAGETDKAVAYALIAIAHHLGDIKTQLNQLSELERIANNLGV